ncbi:MAG: SCO family protein [Saprospiraceae bacterium]
MRNILFYSLIILLLTSCVEREPLKILNRGEEVNGKMVHEKIRDFSFTNQDSLEVTNKTFAGKIYVSNNFFTTCPSICPTTSLHMGRIYDKFLNDDRVRMISHSIDVRTDSVPVLKRYAEGLEIEAPKWNLVTGDEEKILAIAYDYFSNALKDETAPGGFDHDDLFVLIDKDRHIRSICHGTDPDDVDRFMEDIEFLLKSEYSQK